MLEYSAPLWPQKAKQHLEELRLLLEILIIFFIFRHGSDEVSSFLFVQRVACLEPYNTIKPSYIH